MGPRFLCANYDWSPPFSDEARRGVGFFPSPRKIRQKFSTQRWAPRASDHAFVSPRAPVYSTVSPPLPAVFCFTDSVTVDAPLSRTRLWSRSFRRRNSFSVRFLGTWFLFIEDVHSSVYLVRVFITRKRSLWQTTRVKFRLESVFSRTIHDRLLFIRFAADSGFLRLFVVLTTY